MYLISYGCVNAIHSPAAFRISWGVQGVPAIALFVALFFFPESPRWLAQKDRWDECWEVLAHLHGHGDRSSPVVLTELEEVKEAARVAAESSSISVLGLFGPGMWKRTLAGCSVQVWQQLLGGNVMLCELLYPEMLPDQTDFLNRLLGLYFQHGRNGMYPFTFNRVSFGDR